MYISPLSCLGRRHSCCTDEETKVEKPDICPRSPSLRRAKVNIPQGVSVPLGLGAPPVGADSQGGVEPGVCRAVSRARAWRKNGGASWSCVNTVSVICLR